MENPKKPKEESSKETEKKPEIDSNALPQRRWEAADYFKRPNMDGRKSQDKNDEAKKPPEDTIFWLELLIDGLKKDNYTANKPKIDEAKGKINVLKKQIKGKVTEMEKENHDRLIIFESTKGFHKMIGNSAVIYVGAVAERIGRKGAKLLDDKDKYFVNKIGSTSIVINSNFFPRLEKIGLKKVEEESTNSIIVYRLAMPYSEDALKRMQNKIKFDYEKLQQELLPKNSSPLLMRDIEKLIFMIRKTASNSKMYELAGFINETYKEAHELYRDYFGYARAEYNPDVTLQAMARIAKDIRNRIPSFALTNRVSNQGAFAMLELTDEIQKKIRKEQRIQEDKKKKRAAKEAEEATKTKEDEDAIKSEANIKVKASKNNKEPEPESKAETGEGGKKF